MGDIKIIGRHRDICHILPLLLNLNQTQMFIKRFIASTLASTLAATVHNLSESSVPPWLPPWLPQSTISAGTAQDHYIRTKHVKYFFTLRQNVSKTCILALIYG